MSTFCFVYTDVTNNISVLQIPESAIMHIRVTFLPLNFPLEYWIELTTMEPLFVKFILSTSIFYKGVPGFPTDCPVGIWWRGLTACLVYVNPSFGNLV